MPPFSSCTLVTPGVYVFDVAAAGLGAAAEGAAEGTEWATQEPASADSDAQTWRLLSRGT
jgi:hypothetical protein